MSPTSTPAWHTTLVLLVIGIAATLYIRGLGFDVTRVEGFTTHACKVLTHRAAPRCVVEGRSYFAPIPWGGMRLVTPAGDIEIPASGVSISEDTLALSWHAWLGIVMGVLALYMAAPLIRRGASRRPSEH